MTITIYRVNTDYNNKVGTRVRDDTTLGAGAGMKP